MTNPLLETYELPPFHLIKPEHVVPAIEARLKANLLAIENLLDAEQAAWASLVPAIEQMEDELRQAY